MFKLFALILGYDSYDRPSPWASNSQNGGGNKNLFDDSWGRGHDRSSSGLHCVHMRGLPFKASHGDISDVSKHVLIKKFYWY